MRSYAIPCRNICSLLCRRVLYWVALSLLLLRLAAPALADESSDVCYVAHFGPKGGRGDVRAYTLTDNGALQPLQDPVEAGERPRRILLSPDQRFAYLLDNKGYALLAYNIDQHGQLTKRPAGRIIEPTIIDPNGGMAFHRTGKKIYFTEYLTAESLPVSGPPQSQVSVYDRDADGFVSFDTERDSGQIPTSIDVTHDGKHFYVATQGTSRACIYNTNETTGEVTTANEDIRCIDTGPFPVAIKVTPTDTYAWTADSGDGQTGGFTVFKITPSGLLSHLTQVETRGSPQEIEFNSHVTHGVVLDYTGRLLLYQILPNGTPALQTSISIDSHLWAVTFAASDQFLLVPQYDNNIVSAYAFDEATGQLEWRGDSPVGSGPISIACTSGRTNSTSPVANAGTDQIVNNGTVVTLNGTGSSDPDGKPLTFRWTQTAGPAVTLNNADSPTPTFTAPTVSTDAALTFQLVVNDGTTDSAPAQVTITVKALPSSGAQSSDNGQSSGRGQSSGSGGGGGCTLNPGVGFDPMLIGMTGLLLTYLVLPWIRKRLLH